jgi:hypothetical protein
VKRVVRLPAIALIAVGGGIHLSLWRAGYRHIPRIGPWFIANVAVSALLVVAILVRDDARVTIVGIVFSLASLGAIVMSRTVGIFGFTEKVWSPPAVQVVAAETGAVIALTVMLAIAGRALTTTLTPARVRSRRV